MRMQTAIAAGVAAVMLAGGTAGAVQKLAPGVTMQQKNAIVEAGNRFALELYGRLDAREERAGIPPRRWRGCFTCRRRRRNCTAPSPR